MADDWPTDPHEIYALGFTDGACAMLNHLCERFGVDLTPEARIVAMVFGSDPRPTNPYPKEQNS